MSKNRNNPINRPTSTAQAFGQIPVVDVLKRAQEAGELIEHGPVLRGSCLGWTDEGWVLVDVELPMSVAERYATKVHTPNLKAILIERAASRLYNTPRTFGPPEPEGEG